MKNGRQFVDKICQSDRFGFGFTQVNSAQTAERKLLSCVTKLPAFHYRPHL